MTKTLQMFALTNDKLETSIDSRPLVEPRGSAIVNQDKNTWSAYKLCFHQWFLKHHCVTIVSGFWNPPHMSRGVWMWNGILVNVS